MQVTETELRIISALLGMTLFALGMISSLVLVNWIERRED